ncbi:hypothetical protein AAEP93_005422 [Penicillium crustosum]
MSADGEENKFDLTYAICYKHREPRFFVLRTQIRKGSGASFGKDNDSRVFQGLTLVTPLDAFFVTIKDPRMMYQADLSRLASHVHDFPSHQADLSRLASLDAGLPTKVHDFPSHQADLSRLASLDAGLPTKVHDFPSHQADLSRLASLDAGLLRKVHDFPPHQADLSRLASHTTALVDSVDVRAVRSRDGRNHVYIIGLVIA